MLKRLLILVTILLSLSPVVASAVDSVSSIHLKEKEALSAYVDIGDSLNRKYGVVVITYDLGKSVGYFNETVFNEELDVYQRKDFSLEAIAMVKDKNLNPRAKNRLYTFFDEQSSPVAKTIGGFEDDLAPDVVEANRLWWTPFSSPFSMFLGLASVVIMTALSISFILDLSWMILPVVRGMLGVSPKIISPEAKGTIREMASSGQYSHYLNTYFIRRSYGIVIISVCVLYLASGTIYEVILNFFEGIGGFTGG